MFPAKPPLSLLFVVTVVYLCASAFNYGATDSEDAEAQWADSMTTGERRMLK